MFPAQALAETMLARGWRVKLTTDTRGARYTSSFPDAVGIEILTSATFARGGLLAKAGVPLKVLRGVIAARAAFRADRPAVVVGFGGYPSIPAVGAAWLMQLPRALHEQNGVLGRVNQAFARRVDIVACGTWPMHLPKGVIGAPTGNPVRAAILEKAGSAYPDRVDGPLKVVVLGGSQGARILSDMIPAGMAALAPQLRGRLQMSHQARPEDVDRVKDAYAKMEISATVDTFFHDVPARMAAAHLVIARAGASTIADISVIGRPSILVPLASAIRDEQTANARGLVDAGAAVLLREQDLTAEVIAAQVARILNDPQAAQTMTSAALGQARPDATDKLVAIVDKLAGRSG